MTLSTLGNASPAPREKGVQEACGRCAAFALLLAAGAAAWIGAILVCARVH